MFCNKKYFFITLIFFVPLSPFSENDDLCVKLVSVSPSNQSLTIFNRDNIEKKINIRNQIYLESTILSYEKQNSSLLLRENSDFNIICNNKLDKIDARRDYDKFRLAMKS